jgi:hypothetical protein
MTGDRWTCLLGSMVIGAVGWVLVTIDGGPSWAAGGVFYVSFMVAYVGLSQSRHD